MSIHIKSQPSLMTSSSSFNKYDIYNLFNPQYPKPYIYQNYSSTDSPHLNRDLVKDKNNFLNEKEDHLQQMRRQLALIRKKQNEYHDILYGEGSKFLSLNNSASYTNFQTTPRHRLIQRNPFLQGEPSSITQLKTKHANAKLQFNMMHQKQQSLRMNQIDQRQQQQLKIRQALSNKQFRSLVQLKNLQEYRKIKQAQKFSQQSQSQQRRSLMNVSVQNTSGHNNKGSTLFSFGNDTLTGKKFGIKPQMSSRFANSSQRQKMENILEEQDGYDMRITFSGKREPQIIQSRGFRQAKRPPTMMKKRSDDKRDSLSNIRVSGLDSPKTIKLKNKTFYLIAA